MLDNLDWYDLEVMKISQRSEQQGEEKDNIYAGEVGTLAQLALAMQMGQSGHPSYLSDMLE